MTSDLLFVNSNRSHFKIQVKSVCQSITVFELFIGSQVKSFCLRSICLICYIINISFAKYRLIADTVEKRVYICLIPLQIKPNNCREIKELHSNQLHCNNNNDDDDDDDKFV